MYNCLKVHQQKNRFYESCAYAHQQVLQKMSLFGCVGGGFSHFERERSAKETVARDVDGQWGVLLLVVCVRCYQGSGNPRKRNVTTSMVGF